MNGRGTVTGVPHQHHHSTVEPDVRYVTERARRPSRIGDLFYDLLGMVARLVVLAVVVVGLLVAVFVGGFALLSRAVDAIPDTSTTTTSAP
jgi:hypothetical protein